MTADRVNQSSRQSREYSYNINTVASGCVEAQPNTSAPRMWLPKELDRVLLSSLCVRENLEIHIKVSKQRGEVMFDT